MIVPIYSKLENNFSTVADQSSRFILIAKDQGRWDASQLFTLCVVFWLMSLEVPGEFLLNKYPWWTQVAS